MTLRTRIAAVASLSVALVVVGTAVGLYVAVRADLRGEIDSALRSRPRAFAALPGGGAPLGRAFFRALPDAGGLGTISAVPPGKALVGSIQRTTAPFPGRQVQGRGLRIQPAPFGAASGYVQFVSPQGTLDVPGGQGSSPTTIPVRALDRAIAARGSGSTLTDRSVNGTRLRVLTLGVGPAGALLVARPLTEVEKELSRLLLILVLMGAGGILLAALLGALIARTALAPIARFTTSTETLTGSLDLSRRLDVRGRDELGRLAESFNRTLDALERSVEAQRHLIADASHELRTPLALLQAEIELALDRPRTKAELEAALVSAGEEADRLSQLSGDLLLLARADRGGLPITRSAIALDDLFEGIAARFGRRAAASGRRIEVAGAGLRISADALRLEQALGNLVENALRHGEGRVRISARADDDGAVELAVEDEGPGFPPGFAAHAFERFSRASHSRSTAGAGLGLSIVSSIAAAHDGSAEIRGAGVVLRLPAAVVEAQAAAAAAARRPA
jgi:two-component system sensor histidine kinase MprB